MSIDWFKIPMKNLFRNIFTRLCYKKTMMSPAGNLNIVFIILSSKFLKCTYQPIAIFKCFNIITFIYRLSLLI